MTTEDVREDMSETFADAICEQIGPGKKFPSQASAARNIGVSKSLLSIITRGKRDDKGRLLYSRKTAEIIAEKMDIPFSEIPSELRMVSTKEQARKLAAPDRVAFGQKINNAKLARRLKTHQLAREAGITYRNVANAISGVSCTPDTAAKLCKTLNIDLGEIPDCIGNLTLSVIHVALLGSLGITSEAELVIALKEAVINRGLKDLSNKKQREIDKLTFALAEARRQLSQMRALLAKSGAQDEIQESASVSVTPPPDG